MKRFFLLLLVFIFTCTNVKAQVTVSGSTGADGNYTNLTDLFGAFDAINNNGPHTGNNILITISTDISETGFTKLMAGDWASLTINPTGGVPVTLTTFNTQVLIGLNGADNVTIDGLNSGGNMLTLISRSIAPSANTIRFENDATNNIITRCTVLGSGGFGDNYGGTGVIKFGVGSITGNDNNTITQCNISSSVSGQNKFGIWSSGSSIAVDNSNNTISGNNIYDFFFPHHEAAGIYLSFNNSNWTITNNKIYEPITLTAIGGGFYGIYIERGSGYTISNNIIGFANAAGTGTTNLIGIESGSLVGSFPSNYTVGTATGTMALGFTGINCIFTESGAASSIQNNTIAGIAIYTVSGNSTNYGILCGIAVWSGNANIDGNTIGSTTGSNSIYAASYSSTPGAVISGIYCYTNNAINIQNNIMGGIDVSGTTATNATGFKGIEVTGPGNFTVSNNQVGNGTANNIRTGYLLTGGNLSNVATTPTAASGTSAVNGIVSTATGSTLTISNNIIQGIQVSGTATTFTGISNSGLVTSNLNITNNQVGTASAGAVNYSAFATGTVYGIYNTQHPVTCSVSISNNDIRGIVHSMGSSSIQVYIGNMASGQVGNLVINGNTFTNLSVNTSSGIAFIAREGHMTATSSAQCSNNSIVGSFKNDNAGATSTTMYFYFVQNLPSQSVNGSVVTVTNNNFSNVTVNGAVSIQGYYDLEGVSNTNAPTKTYTGNVMNNITMGTGTIYAMYINNSARVICSTNVVSNISTGGFIAGIWHGSTNGQGPDHVSNNTVSNLASGSANVVGIMAGSLGVPNLTVSGNVVSGLSSTGTTNVQLVGIEIIQGQTINVSNNQVNNIQGSGVGASTFAYGIRVNTGTAVQVYQNKIYDVKHVGNTSAVPPGVIGIQSVNPLNLTLYNNFIADLKAPNSGQADAIRGININALGANTTYKLYYNSVYINAASSGTNFGTTGIFHTGNAIATTGRLEMINNIIVNTSTPNGTGITTAFRRSNTTLTNFAAASDYNLFYAGTPSASRLIFYDGTNSDQTLSAYQTRVSTRDANSISIMPSFVSATDLHLTNLNNCALDGTGIPIAGYTTDIDNQVRDIAAPDIGADEFTAAHSTILAGIASTAVCENKTISPTGSYYATNTCNIIAYVLPSGGSAVAGKINTCVTLDATQQYFNGAPYVQRHFDIEPATNPASSTANISLYFTDAEFVAYNNNNPMYPKLPTVLGGANSDPFRSNIRVTQFHGTPTGGLPTSTPGNYTGTRVLINPGLAGIFWNGFFWRVSFDITGFSGFYLHTTLTNTPLPIVVNYLTGRKQGSGHLLNWKVTCTSTPRATMTLERSSDSRNYSGIHTIIADANRCQQPFDHIDTDPLKGMNYYRLKIVDADGKVTYSTTVALLNAVKGFDIISIAPNPVVDNNFKLNVASAQAGKMEISIFDMQGRLMSRQPLSLIAGYNSLPINVSNLSRGTYTIKAGMSDDQSKVIRFVKQ